MSTAWSAVVHVHRQLIWQGPICADLQVIDPDLPGNDSAKIVCDEEAQNLAISNNRKLRSKYQITKVK